MIYRELLGTVECCVPENATLQEAYEIFKRRSVQFISVLDRFIKIISNLKYPYLKRTVRIRVPYGEITCVCTIRGAVILAISSTDPSTGIMGNVYDYDKNDHVTLISLTSGKKDDISFKHDNTSTWEQIRDDVVNVTDNPVLKHDVHICTDDGTILKVTSSTEPEFLIYNEHMVSVRKKPVQNLNDVLNNEDEYFNAMMQYSIDEMMITAIAAAIPCYHTCNMNIMCFNDEMYRIVLDGLTKLENMQCIR